MKNATPKPEEVLSKKLANIKFNLETLIGIKQLFNENEYINNDIYCSKMTHIFSGIFNETAFLISISCKDFFSKTILDYFNDEYNTDELENHIIKNDLLGIYGKVIYEIENFTSTSPQLKDVFEAEITEIQTKQKFILEQIKNNKFEIENSESKLKIDSQKIEIFLENNNLRYGDQNCKFSPKESQLLTELSKDNKKLKGKNLKIVDKNLTNLSGYKKSINSKFTKTFPSLKEELLPKGGYYINPAYKINISI